MSQFLEAKRVIRQRLISLAKEILPSLPDFIRNRKIYSIKEMIQEVSHYMTNENRQKNEYLMLYSFSKNRYWGAAACLTDWKDEGTIQESDFDFYARHIIAMARLNRFSNGDSRNGYGFLLRIWDESVFRPYIPETLLPVIVNRAFTEIAKQNFNRPPGFSPMNYPKYYDLLLKYVDLLNFSLPYLKAFDSLLYDQNHWTQDFGYVNKIAKIAHRLSRNRAAYLIHPIIDSAIDFLFNDNLENFNRLVALFNKYIQHPSIQKLIIFRFEENLSSSHTNIEALTKLLDYILLSISEKQEWISNLIANEKPFDIISVEIPVQWVNKNTKLAIRQKLIMQIEQDNQENPRVVITDGDIIISAYKLGWLSKKWASSFLNNRLKRLVNGKKPSCKELEHFLYFINFIFRREIDLLNLTLRFQAVNYAIDLLIKKGQKLSGLEFQKMLQNMPNINTINNSTTSV